jgi:hypothetical protein
MANSDSDFWREFAANFQALSIPYSDLRADWTYVLKSGTLGDWRIVGNATQRSQFESLARRAATRLPEKRSTDLLVAWLTALKEVSIGFILSDRFPTEMNDDGSKGATYMMGSIARLCEASANFCRKLESEALQAEFEEKLRNASPFEGTPRPDSTPRPHESTTQPCNETAIFSPSPTYQKLLFRGKEYDLTQYRYAPQILRILHESVKKGEPGLTTSQIRKRANLPHNGKMYDWFRGTGLWKNLVVTAGRDLYRLDISANP